MHLSGSAHGHTSSKGTNEDMPSEKVAGDLEGHLHSLTLSSPRAPRQGGTLAGPSAVDASPWPSLGHTGLPLEPSSNRDQHEASAVKSAMPSRARKRPNQAQRRLMNAQVTFPTDQAESFRSLAPPSTPHAAAAVHRDHRLSTDIHGGQPLQAPYDDSYTHRVWSQDATLYTTQTQFVPLQGPGPAIRSPRNITAAPFTSHGRQHEHQSFHGRGRGHLPPFTSTWRRDEMAAAHQHRGPPMRPANSETLARQAGLLDRLCITVVAGTEIDREEISKNEAFRLAIETLCRSVISKYEHDEHGVVDFPEASVQLKCFGSLSSGLATKSSDMDLGLLSPMSTVPPDAPGSPIPRLLERAFLDAGLGARLLTRTRVPILKLCEFPSPQLLSDLRGEREKWESDLATVAADGIEDQDPNNGSGLEQACRDEPDTALDGHSMDETLSCNPKTAETAREVVCVAGCSNGLSQPGKKPTDNQAHLKPIHLSQAQGQSLYAYYTSAKRTLRKLGGQDITSSNHKMFTKDDYELLTALSRAFLCGLRNEALRERVLSAFDSQTLYAPESRDTRSLLRLYTQVEGEDLLMQWERRILTERTTQAEQAASRHFETWKALVSKPVSGFKSFRLTKDLQVVLERIKTFPSVQINILEQGQYESASHYSSRSARLLSELVPRHPNLSGCNVEKEVLERYVAGIHHVDIRAGVAQFARALADDFPFLAATRKHKALHLAHQFEKALAAGCYPAAARNEVRSYIGILRGGMRRVHHADGRSEWIIPISEASTGVLASIRLLTDPSKLATNRPRDMFSDKLEFPQSGTGVQCDLNFSAHLALQNTLLLRCYSHSDSRVRPFILFIKHWAKVRNINTAYRGTLSSYGYVLMALHFLVNVAKPFVCPNLQKLAPPPPPGLSPEQLGEAYQCKGRDTRFWRDEQEIARLAREDRLNQNKESIGELLRGFFEYYAHGGVLSTQPGRGFDWGREVLSLRTAEGLLTKQEKGWTGAKTTIISDDIGTEPGLKLTATNSRGQTTLGSVYGDNVPPANPSNASTTSRIPEGPNSASQKSRDTREVRHRYLLAIEDPFELDHNVARTVTHNGIVSIRDEFRRAWRIIENAGAGREDDDLLRPADTTGTRHEGETFSDLLAELHGPSFAIGRPDMEPAVG
jgi:terminal uridylyltransferase